jgi:hypothetical protein
MIASPFAALKYPAAGAVAYPSSRINSIVDPIRTRTFFIVLEEHTRK